MPIVVKLDGAIGLFGFDGRRPSAAVDVAAVCAEPAVLRMLLSALAGTQVGFCLADEQDYVRYVNPVFREAFMPGVDWREPVEFIEGLATGIRAGQGIKLESLPLEQFIPRVRRNRQTAPRRYDFAVDFADGRWFWVNDHKLANGWLLCVATDITSIKGEELQLKREHARALAAARTDHLTGLPNRLHGLEYAEAAFDRAREGGAPLAIAMLDIDHFKSINDRFGHEVGDQVLIHFAQLAGDRLGPRDQLSRLGGEEFLLTLPDATPLQAEGVLDRLLDTRTCLASGAPVPYSISAGLARAGVDDIAFKTVLERADAALYRAKANGRARIELQRV